MQFTGCRGFWEARSSVGWLDMTHKKSFMLVMPSQPLHFISNYPAHEFDDLVVTLWTFVVGEDMVQSWIDRGAVNRA
jgi:hypothetical protein